jgi:hypothetical protein
MGLYGTIWDYMGLYGTIWDYMGLYRDPMYVYVYVCMYVCRMIYWGGMGVCVSVKMLMGCASVLNTTLLRSISVSGSCARYRYFMVSARKKDSMRSSMPPPMGVMGLMSLMSILV